MHYLDLNTTQLLALSMMLGSIPVRHLFEQRWNRNGTEAAPTLPEPKLALAAALDAAKVFIPVFLAVMSYQKGFVVGLVGIIGVVSSCFPYWLMFKPQGKGLASALGFLMGLNFFAGACVLAIWMITLWISDRFVIATLVSAIFAPVCLRFFGSPGIFICFGLAGCVYVVVAHSYNIDRLIDGKEPRWRK